MSKQQEIVVDVYPDGSCTVDIEGVVGPKCHDIMKQLQQRGLGKQVKDVSKSEYYQQNTNTNRITNSRG